MRRRSGPKQFLWTAFAPAALVRLRLGRRSQSLRCGDGPPCQAPGCTAPQTRCGSLRVRHASLLYISSGFAFFASSSLSRRSSAFGQPVLRRCPALVPRASRASTVHGVPSPHSSPTIYIIPRPPPHLPCGSIAASHQCCISHGPHLTRRQCIDANIVTSIYLYSVAALMRGALTSARPSHAGSPIYERAFHGP